MTVKGTVEDIRFRNDENGYCILTLDNGGEPLTCVGTFPPISEGETLLLEGEMVMHPKYGKQLKVNKVSSAVPETADEIVRYLGSGIIRGVGPKTALAIVGTFGEKALEVIELRPHLLARVKGISKAKALDIADSYAEIRAMKDAVMFLQKHGVSLNMSLKIYKEYADETVATVMSNPYVLIETIQGIGFATADRIAASMGIEADNPRRVRAGIIYTLGTLAERAGNTYLPYEMLNSEVCKLLGLNTDTAVGEVTDVLVFERKLKKIFAEEEGVMLSSTYRCEKNIATILARLIDESDMGAKDLSEQEIAEFERANSITFADQQKSAVELAVKNGVCIITGGPGTGKTTIIKCILSIFSHRNINTALMAPTGRAAKRLSESTGEDASTIHRALMSEGMFSDTPIAAGAVIVDEFSMVDIYLFETLLKALSPGTKLILVGDKDQLPSVGAGNLLADMLGSGRVESVRLDKIFRQDESSMIITNAHLINSGEMPDLSTKTGDFFFMRNDDPRAAADTVVELVSRRLPSFLQVEPQRIQVLCPLKNGVVGTNNLNARLAAAVNPAHPSKRVIEVEDAVFREGDKVMHIVNNYSLEWRKRGSYLTGAGVFNGDMGIITEIEPENGSIEVEFEDGRVAVYTPDIRAQLILSYAVTVHKSQGSEFDAVVLPVTAGSPVMMTRNLLYTAITRAKRLVVLVGEAYNIKRMVENNYIAKRYSGLKTFLEDAFSERLMLYKNDNTDGENKEDE